MSESEKKNLSPFLPRKDVQKVFGQTHRGGGSPTKSSFSTSFLLWPGLSYTRTHTHHLLNTKSCPSLTDSFIH